MQTLDIFLARVFSRKVPAHVGSDNPRIGGTRLHQRNIRVPFLRGAFSAARERGSQIWPSKQTWRDPMRRLSDSFAL